MAPSSADSMHTIGSASTPIEIMNPLVAPFGSFFLPTSTEAELATGVAEQLHAREHAVAENR